MRIDRANVDKFAKLFKAGGAARKRGKGAGGKRRLDMAKPSPSPDHSYDDEIAPGTQLHKTRRERELEALAYEDRRWKRYCADRQRRLDRITQEFPQARRFLKTLAKVETSGQVKALAFRDVDVDLAGLAGGLQLADIPNDYDRFTVFERAVEMVDRVAKRAGYTEHDPSTFFVSGLAPTALDELKTELRLT